MEEKNKDNFNLPLEEEKALEDFFRALNLAFKSASMYFKEHPSFIRSIDELKERLNKVSLFRKSLSLRITPESIILDGKYFKKGLLPYKELAPYLHKRRIKSLKINTSVSSDNLRSLVFALASSLKEIQEGKPAREIIANTEGIEIEELDYSLLLATKGEHPQDIWKVLLSKDSDLSKKSVQCLADNLESILKEAEEASLGKGLLENLFSNLEKVGKSIEANSLENAKGFVEGISGSLFRLPQEFLSAFLETNNFPELKGLLLKYLDKEIFFEAFIKQIISTKKVNLLFLNLYNTIFKENKDEKELAEAIAKSLTKKDFLKDKEKILEPLRELFLKDPSNKFLSILYKNTLSSLIEHSLDSFQTVQISKEDLEDLDEGEINYHYFYILIELIRIEDNISDLEILASKTEEQLSAFLGEEKIKVLKELIGAIEEKLIFSKSKELKDTLKSFSKRLLNLELLEFILKNISSFEDIEDLVFILKRIKETPSYIVNEFIKSKNLEVHKKLKEILIGLGTGNAFTLLKNYLKKESNVFILKEVIDILSRLKTKDSLEFLEEIYEDNRNNKPIILEVLRAMKRNPFKKKNFFEPFILSRDYFLREEAVSSILDIAKQKDRENLINKFLNIKNLLGIKDEFVMENIDILLEHNIKEIIPYLIRFVLKKPLIFKKKRDRLRIKSLESLIKINPQEVKKILPFILRDKNKKIKKLALRFKEECKI